MTEAEISLINAILQLPAIRDDADYSTIKAMLDAIVPGGGAVDLEEYEADGFSLTATDIGGITADENNGVKLSAYGEGIELLLDTTFGDSDIRLTSAEDIVLQALSGDVELAAGDRIDISGAVGVEVYSSGEGYVKIADGDDELSFYGVTPITRPAGVAVTAGAIHAALVALGLISA